jgi:hypothetical protein
LDYFQGVVTEYLRADRAVFVNTECCIQLNAGLNPDTSGPHWYCDAVAVNLREKRVYLCEVTYSRTLDALIKRLASWNHSWTELRSALVRDCHILEDWPVCPWVFIPGDRRPLLGTKLSKLPGAVTGREPMPAPKVTDLEDVVPWKYRSWNRYAFEEGEDA